MPEPQYAKVQSAVQQSNLTVIAKYMLPLMLRNMSSDGFVFVDPADLGEEAGGAPPKFSAPGCIIASPSFGSNLPSVKQDYVYNWTRDAAVVAIEIALATLPAGPGGSVEPLCDYVNFATRCQANALPNHFSRAACTIEGEPRDPWGDQNDGPALQTLAILQAFNQLDSTTQDSARTVAARNLDFLLANYQNPTLNLWEEVEGQSFFTRSVQLRCLTEIKNNTLGVTVPPGTDDAISWLKDALQKHWDAGNGYYVSILEPTREDYDPNIDIVMASVYGAVDCTDPQLLATATKLRQQWSDPASPHVYPINEADKQRELGPLLGRYPGDTYDGDNNDSGTDHPWVLCTANFAQLYYNVAAAVEPLEKIPDDEQTAAFLAQAGVNTNTKPTVAAAQLRKAGDKMLQAIVYHSDHFELSEQFDGTTGYEKSVADLTWSYAAFLSAVRARTRPQLT